MVGARPEVFHASCQWPPVTCAFERLGCGDDDGWWWCCVERRGGGGEEREGGREGRGVGRGLRKESLEVPPTIPHDKRYRSRTAVVTASYSSTPGPQLTSVPCRLDDQRAGSVSRCSCAAPPSRSYKLPPNHDLSSGGMSAQKCVPVGSFVPSTDSYTTVGSSHWARGSTRIRCGDIHPVVLSTRITVLLRVD